MRAFGGKKASSEMSLLLSYPFLPIGQMVVWPGYFEPNAVPYIPIGGNHWCIG